MTDGRNRFASREPKRDPRLARAIRDAEGLGPSRARLEFLRARIAIAAASALEAQRDRAWWEWMTRWARGEVAFAAAATILAFAAGHITSFAPWELAVRAAPTVIESTTSGGSLGAAPVDSVVARSLAAGESAEQVLNAIVGPVSGEWLLTAAVIR